MAYARSRPSGLAVRLRVVRFATTFVVLAAALSACGENVSPNAEPDPTAAAVGSGNTAAARVVLVDDLGDARQVGPRDPVRVTAARVDGDTLRLSLEYGGGCRQHTFRLAASRAFRESYPVQVAAALGHDANGDNCRALLRSDLAVALTPIADAYRAGYQTRAGVVLLVLDGTTAELRYEFR